MNNDLEQYGGAGWRLVTFIPEPRGNDPRALTFIAVFTREEP